MTKHVFVRREGRTYSLCTLCGTTMRLPHENEARACDPTKKRKWGVDETGPTLVDLAVTSRVVADKHT